MGKGKAKGQPSTMGKGKAKGQAPGPAPKGKGKGKKGKAQSSETTVQSLRDEISKAPVTPQRKFEIVKVLKARALHDFPINQPPYYWTAEKAEKMANARVQIFWKLFSFEKRDQLHADQVHAKVSDASMQALKAHDYPLPFNSRAGLLRFFRSIRDCIEKDTAHQPFRFSLLVSGSGVKFYSENPDKPGHYFDKIASSGQDAGDIDVGVAPHPDDLWIVHKIFGGPPKHHPKFGDAMYGASATLKHFPSLADFYSKVGNHPFVKIGNPAEKRYNRDVGIVLYNFDWHKSSTVSTWWQADFVFSSVADDIVEPTTCATVCLSSAGKGKSSDTGKGQGKVHSSTAGKGGSKGKGKAAAHGKGA